MNLWLRGYYLNVAQTILARFSSTAASSGWASCSEDLGALQVTIPRDRRFGEGTDAVGE